MESLTVEEMAGQVLRFDIYGRDNSADVEKELAKIHSDRERLIAMMAAEKFACDVRRKELL